jgi:uncharacterized protein YjbI with pentapeptide repeats
MQRHACWKYSTLCTRHLTKLPLQTVLKSRANVSNPADKKPAARSKPQSVENHPVGSKAAPERHCPVTMGDGKPCGRPVTRVISSQDRDWVCIMHTHGPKDTAVFQREFQRILNSTWSGIADFTRFVFPKFDCGPLQFYRHSVFDGAQFTQPVSFSRATFTQAAFRNTRFMKGADFGEVVFEQDVDFTGATFREAANFHRVRFIQRPVFTDAKFMMDAYFAEARLTQGGDFRRVTFEHDANFSEAAFTRPTDFTWAKFNRDAYFNGSRFTDWVDFTRARFAGTVEFRETEFRRTGERIPGPVFSMVEFSGSGSVIFYKTYLGHALLHNCDLSRVAFVSVEWRRRNGNGKRMVFEENVDLGHKAAFALVPKEGSPDERDYELIEGLYQQLKKNYDDAKDYWTAGDFHFGEMEMKRLATPPGRRIASLMIRLGFNRLKVNRLRQSLHRTTGIAAWYKRASDYGESYSRPGFLLLGVLLAFALIYPVVGLTSATAKDPPQAGGEAAMPNLLTYQHPFLPGQQNVDIHQAKLQLFGKSCLTALEIAAFQREPAYRPTIPWGRIFSLLEAALTSTLLALFLLAVRRQFRR